MPSTGKLVGQGRVSGISGVGDLKTLPPGLSHDFLESTPARPPSPECAGAKGPAGSWEGAASTGPAWLSTVACLTNWPQGAEWTTCSRHRCPASPLSPGSGLGGAPCAAGTAARGQRHSPGVGPRVREEGQRVFAGNSAWSVPLAGARTRPPFTRGRRGDRTYQALRLVPQGAADGSAFPSVAPAGKRRVPAAP